MLPMQETAQATSSSQERLATKRRSDETEQDQNDANKRPHVDVTTPGERWERMSPLLTRPAYTFISKSGREYMVYPYHGTNRVVNYDPNDHPAEEATDLIGDDCHCNAMLRAIKLRSAFVKDGAKKANMERWFDQETAQEIRKYSMMEETEGFYYDTEVMLRVVALPSQKLVCFMTDNITMEFFPALLQTDRYAHLHKVRLDMKELLEDYLRNKKPVDVQPAIPEPPVNDFESSSSESDTDDTDNDNDGKLLCLPVPYPSN